ncbi:hypothetical protein [Rugosimonospora africana]|uniref:hypothetical protein n=1 Tax=Rugosimonospora africana TaxID=556532 RepID=UPI0019450375|nr:hypothetical protein [Rugosimonospora africana]
MTTRRIAIASLAALAVVGFAAGCKGTTTGAAGGGASAGTGGTASSAPAVAPKDALVASTKQLSQTSYHYTITSTGLTGSGASDPASKSASMSMSGAQQGTSMKLDLIKVDTDIYLKMDAGQLNSQLGVSPDKWMHIDAAAMGANNSVLSFPGGGDTDVNGLLAGVVNVQSTDGKTLTGTLDLTKATGNSAVSADALSKAGAKAKAVPFTAVLDDQGRLSSLKIDGSGIQDGLTVNMTFTDYGKPAGISKPDSSSVVEAPDTVQKMFQQK